MFYEFTSYITECIVRKLCQKYNIEFGFKNVKKTTKFPISTPMLKRSKS